ncbi:hypothetical protein BKA69DRAFT_1056176 [Paraphysoderma sedebokerense]|nr:hypothetical protein BKA69DRAFT_1056176 [Paraphysoderma sedebokerense]
MLGSGSIQSFFKPKPPPSTTSDHPTTLTPQPSSANPSSPSSPSSSIQSPKEPAAHPPRPAKNTTKPSKIPKPKSNSAKSKNTNTKRQQIQRNLPFIQFNKVNDRFIWTQWLCDLGNLVVKSNAPAAAPKENGNDGQNGNDSASQMDMDGDTEMDIDSQDGLQKEGRENKETEITVDDDRDVVQIVVSNCTGFYQTRVKLSQIQSQIVKGMSETDYNELFQSAFEWGSVLHPDGSGEKPSKDAKKETDLIIENTGDNIEVTVQWTPSETVKIELFKAHLVAIPSDQQPEALKMIFNYTALLRSMTDPHTIACGNGNRANGARKSSITSNASKKSRKSKATVVKSEIENLAPAKCELSVEPVENTEKENENEVKKDKEAKEAERLQKLKEKEEQKEKERQLKEEQKRKEKEEKEKKLAEKAAEREKKEAEKRAAKEAKEAEKKAAKEAKDAERKAKEEEKIKKEEELKKKAQAQARLNMFFSSKPKSQNPEPVEPKETPYFDQLFKDFHVKSNTAMAPLRPVEICNSDDIVELINSSNECITLEDSLKHIHRSPIYENYRSRQQQKRKWKGVGNDNDDDVVIVSADDDMINMMQMEIMKKVRPKMKLIQFAENWRPAYWGTFSKSSTTVSGRRPLAQDTGLFDYEYESEDEWEEEGEGEDLNSDDDNDDCESEKSDADENDEEGNDWLVPEGYLSEDEIGEREDTEGDESPKRKSEFKKRIVQPLVPVVVGPNFDVDIYQESSIPALRPFRLQFFIETTQIDPFNIVLDPPQSESNENQTADSSATGTPSAKVHGNSSSNQSHGKTPSTFNIPPEHFSSVLKIVNGNQGVPKMVEELKTLFPKVPKNHFVNTIKNIAERKKGGKDGKLAWWIKEEVLAKFGKENCGDNPIENVGSMALDTPSGKMKSTVELTPSQSKSLVESMTTTPKTPADNEDINDRPNKRQKLSAANSHSQLKESFSLNLLQQAQHDTPSSIRKTDQPQFQSASVNSSPPVQSTPLSHSASSVPNSASAPGLSTQRKLFDCVPFIKSLHGFSCNFHKFEWSSSDPDHANAQSVLEGLTSAFENNQWDKVKDGLNKLKGFKKDMLLNLEKDMLAKLVTVGANTHVDSAVRSRCFRILGNYYFDIKEEFARLEMSEEDNKDAFSDLSNKWKYILSLKQFAPALSGVVNKGEPVVLKNVFRLLWHIGMPGYDGLDNFLDEYYVKVSQMLGSKLLEFVSSDNVEVANFAASLLDMTVSYQKLPTEAMFWENVEKLSAVLDRTTMDEDGIDKYTGAKKYSLKALEKMLRIGGEYVHKESPTECESERIQELLARLKQLDDEMNVSEAIKEAAKGCVSRLIGKNKV